MTRQIIDKLSEKLRQQDRQIARQAEMITARNIKILKLERQIAAMERREGK